MTGGNYGNALLTSKTAFRNLMIAVVLEKMAVLACASISGKKNL